MPRHLHRDPFRNAGADEIADSGSAEVVENPTRASSLGTRRPERHTKALDGSSRTVEDARTDDLELPLKILGDCALLFKHFAQLARHRERAPLAVLGFSRVEPDLPGAEIDLAPFERQHLAIDPPPSDVRERRRWSNGFGQMCQHRQELIALEEPDPYVVFLQKRDVRLLQQLPCLNRDATTMAAPGTSDSYKAVSVAAASYSA